MQFSHIYIEHSVVAHPLTKHIQEQFPHAQVIPIDNYKHMFNRTHQNFMLQRSSRKLILARQGHTFLHKGNDRVRSFGDPHVYSCSMIRNCVYHCEYCFLHGMHESANIVIYVNIEDFEDAIRTLSRQLSNEKIYLITSYLSDLPAFEYFIPICRSWIAIADSLHNVELEIRTKSDGYRFLQKIPKSNNTILVWSMSPQGIVRKYEHGTASLHTRILQASQAIQDGWRVRICFDPIIYSEYWEREYQECIDQVFARCSPHSVEAVSYGVFRMGQSYLQNMRKNRPASAVLQRDIVIQDSLGTYASHRVKTIQDIFLHMLSRYLPTEKVSFVHG